MQICDTNTTVVLGQWLHHKGTSHHQVATDFLPDTETIRPLVNVNGGAATIEDWDTLSKHDDWRVRLLVADNLKCLDVLVNDPVPEVANKAKGFIQYLAA